MSRQTTESKAPDSSEPRAPPRGNDLLFEELEEGQVDYEEPVASEAHSNAASARSHTSGVSSGAASARSYGSTTMSPPRRVLRTPNPFAERYNPVRALRDAPPLTSRYEEDRRDPNVITNDLDEAQSRQLSTDKLAAAQPSRGSATHPSLLDTYVCEPSAATADQQVRRHTLRERFLTQQVTTPQEYRERLQQQLHGQPVPAMRTVPVIIRPGEATTAYEAQFQNWVERARRLPSYEALRASFSETDIRLERRLRLDFAKLKAWRQLPGPRPQHHEAPPPPAPAKSTAAHVHEPAAPATGQSLSSAADLSSPRSSGRKRSAPGDAVARRDGALATDVPGHKRQRRLGNPAGGEPQTPMSFVNEGNLATSQDIGAGGVFKTKLRPRFIGPFKIVAKKGLAYTLNLPKKMRTHPVFYVGLLKPFQDSAQVGVEALAPGQQETAEPQAAGRQRVAEPQDVERTAEGAATDQADPAAEQPDAQGRRPGSEGHSVPQTSPPDGASLRDLLLSGRVKRSRHERRNSASEYADLAQSRRGDSQREGPGEADTACVGLGSQP
ncbi:hypothetical protein PC117_g24511 [Phytophthora cactorum]|uniref:Tf2-1-like SH3-like domain-containing protein n=2 Tax=Phytophthora cactorum TaxID=29920 RepID=A0A8T1AYY0_9STRA|nr:hypothetical protein PC117_g24511 [Phytophthora cactorum]